MLASPEEMKRACRSFTSITDRTVVAIQAHAPQPANNIKNSVPTPINQTRNQSLRRFDMKRLLTICNLAIAIQLFIAYLMLPCLTRHATAATAFQAIKTVPLYRYQSARGHYLYTTSANLPAGLSDGPWEKEGIAAHVPNYTRQTKPVYWASKSDDHGVHYVFTSDINEISGIGKQGYAQQSGAAFYVASEQLPGTAPLHRLYKPAPTNPQAKKGLLEKVSDLFAGEKFTAPPAGFGDSHFYTAFEGEKSTAMQSGYQYQGIVGYVWLAPYPPPPAALPDILVHSTKADEFSVTAIVANKGKANTGGIKYEVTLSVFDTDGKLVFKSAKIAPGLSPDSADQLVFNTQGKSLYGTRYQLTVDTTNVLKESNESNNQTAMLDGPRRKIDLSKVDTERVIPPSIEMTGKQESKARDRVMTIYQFTVSNWNEYPAEWFQPLKSLDPIFCDGKSTDARMLLHLGVEADGKQIKAGCKPLNSPQELKAVQTAPTGGQIPKPDKVVVILEDRLAGKRYLSNGYPVEVFGVDKELFTVGCKRFLGRAASFICTKKLGFESCENLRKQGKPIECRMAGNQQ
jgi:hypothetical protein